MGKPTGITTTVTAQGVPQTITTSNVYNPFNDPLQTIDTRGNSTYFTYTTSGNPKFITDTVGQVTGYQYDTQGRITTITTTKGLTTTFEYNSLGQTVAMTQTYATLVTTNGITPIVHSYRTNYQYYPQGWLKYQSDPYDTLVGPGAGISYEYDALGHSTVITNQLSQRATNQYDKIGNLITGDCQVAGVNELVSIFA
jgi:YD repeat-containing protein